MDEMGMLPKGQFLATMHGSCTQWNKSFSVKFGAFFFFTGM